MTKITTGSPQGECPTWKSFLATVTGGDRELQDYLRRMAGYCLTGVTTEHALFFLYGTGANGKSVFANTLTSIMGDYATVAAMDMFMATHGDRHPTDMASLRGARIVTSIETEQGSRWAESKLKALTGGDKITARFMRQDFFEFMPQFKLLVVGNHKPSIRNVDEAMRRRLHMVPFTVTIPKAKRDKTLPERLLAERDGILAWALEGCLEWQRMGLKPPPAVMAATEDYFEAEDAIGRWIDERCERGAFSLGRLLRPLRQLESLGRGQRRIRRIHEALLGNAERAGVRKGKYEAGAGLSRAQNCRHRHQSLRRRKNPMKSMAATDVTGCTYIGVTRAYARAYEGHREVSVTSVASVAASDFCRSVSKAGAEVSGCRCFADSAWRLRGWSSRHDPHLPHAPTLMSPANSRTTAARTFHSTRLPPSSTTTINLSEGKTIMAPATLAMPAAKASPSILSILALDLGSTTGWALRNDRCRILHGTAAFRPDALRRWRHALPPLRALARRDPEDRRRHRCRLLRGGPPARWYRRSPYLRRLPRRADGLVRGRRASPTRACRSAPSSASPPARGMPTSRR